MIPRRSDCGSGGPAGRLVEEQDARPGAASESDLGRQLWVRDGGAGPSATRQVHLNKRTPGRNRSKRVPLMCASYTAPRARQLCPIAASLRVGAATGSITMFRIIICRSHTRTGRTGTCNEA
jgi:hypothetical protein